MVKISSLLIGLVLVSAIMGLFGISLNNSASTFDTEFDNTSINTMNQLNELSADGDRLKEDLDEIKQPSGILDILGSIFSAGYGVLKSLFNSITFSTVFVNEGINNLNLGESSNIIIKLILTVLTILIVIGVVLSAILKKDV